MRADRKRGIETDAGRTLEVFRAECAHQPMLVEDALGQQMFAILIQLKAGCTAADHLAKPVAETFPHHPDADVILGFPALAASSAPGCCQRSETTEPGSPTPAA
ncbi:hypothetical protein AB4225_23380 [Streptomyces sp. 2RAF24]|uniref:hypothetical protein n=1 Tax=Streptomyces sp. NPDC046374 TaxID=3154917 RepID=UPI0033CCEF2C